MIQAPLIRVSAEARRLHPELMRAGGAKRVSGIKCVRGDEERALLVQELAEQRLVERRGAVVELTERGRAAWVASDRERWARS